MKDLFTEHIASRLNEGTAYPDSTVWNKINSELDNAEFASKVSEKLLGLKASPSDASWEQIQNHLPGNKSSRWIPVSLLASAAILLIAIGFIFLKQDESAFVVISNPIVQNKKLMPGNKVLNPEMIPTKNKSTDKIKLNIDIVAPLDTDNFIAIKNEIRLPEKQLTEMVSDEIQSIPIPDSVFISGNEKNSFQDNNISDADQNSAYLQPLIPKRPKLESAFNYVMNKILNARHSKLRLTLRKTSKGKVWAYAFNSRLVGIKGNIKSQKFTYLK